MFQDLTLTAAARGPASTRWKNQQRHILEDYEHSKPASQS